MTQKNKKPLGHSNAIPSHTLLGINASAIRPKTALKIYFNFPVFYLKTHCHTFPFIKKYIVTSQRYHLCLLVKKLSFLLVKLC